MKKVGLELYSKKSDTEIGIGKPDRGKTEFISTIKDIDIILAESKGNVDYIAETLGIPKSQLKGSTLLRINFKKTTKYKPKIPLGNKWGANDMWLTGGKLPTGKLETIIKTKGMRKDIDYVVADLITGEKL